MDEESEKGPTLISSGMEPSRMAGISSKAPVVFADDLKCLLDTTQHIATLIFFKDMYDVKQEGKEITLDRTDIQGILQVKMSIHRLYETVFFLQGVFDKYNGAIPAGLHFGPTFVEPKKQPIVEQTHTPDE